MRHQAIYNTHLEVKCVHDNGGAFDIDGNSVEVDEALVSQEIVKLQAEYKAKEYRQLRQYPPIGDQLDAIWKGGDAQADMLKQVMAVKDKYPKGTK
jgi:hypothetical protein